MISPELLRRYPFFAFLTDAQLKAVAMIANEEQFENGAVLFKEGEQADAFYFLLTGSVDLYFSIQEEFRPQTRKDFSVGEINSGEPLGISTLIEPYVLTATARCAAPVHLIRIDGEQLRKLCDQDIQLHLKFIRQAAKLAMERLHTTRIQLAAAWA